MVAGRMQNSLGWGFRVCLMFDFQLGMSNEMTVYVHHIVKD